MDWSNIVTALITGGVTLLGVIIANSKTLTEIKVEINHLTKAVEKHNNFATRIPVIEEKLSVANHRIEDLEKKVN